MTSSSRQRLRFYLGCYGLMAPTFVLLAIFMLVPFVWAFVSSFYRFEVGGASEFVGFENFKSYLTDPTLGPSFGNMLFLTVFSVFVIITVPLVVAKLIFSLASDSARYVYRILFLLPLLIPNVATMMIWRELVYPESGLLNEILVSAGLGRFTNTWLANPDTVLWAVAFVGFPWANGINILIYYAGFANIPTSVHEAAQLDGATGIRKFFLIDLPLVFSQMKMLVILAFIMGVQSFEGIFVLTRGNPGFKSMVPGLWMYYNAFSFQRMGTACAIGVILFFIILGLTILNIRYFRTSESLQGVTR